MPINDTGWMISDNASIWHPKMLADLLSGASCSATPSKKAGTDNRGQ